MVLLLLLPHPSLAGGEVEDVHGGFGQDRTERSPLEGGDRRGSLLLAGAVLEKGSTCHVSLFPAWRPAARCNGSITIDIETAFSCWKLEHAVCAFRVEADVKTTHIVCSAAFGDDARRRGSRR